MSLEILKYTRLDDRLWHYRAKIVRVIDGDSVEALIDKGFGDYRREHLRLHGIDTPELRPRKGTPEERLAEKAEALRAKNRVIQLVEGREVVIRSHKAGKYGRWLATIFLPPEDAVSKLGAVVDPQDPPTLNQLLLDEGLAEPYGK
jgi:micrococcal nuclease